VKTYGDIAIIGAGPAGMYCASELTQAGKKVIIVERGPAMEDRVCPKNQYCDCGVCNILCGIGGAGGFSDGKNTLSLTRGTQMEELFPPEAGQIMETVDKSVAHYAGTEGVIVPEVTCSSDHRFNRNGFRFSSYPLRHIGSDGIRKWATNMRASLAQQGVTFITGCDAIKILDGSGGRGVHGVKICNQTIRADTVIAATGLDGAPWLYKELVRCGATFQPGPAGIAIRLETASDVLAPLFDVFYDWKMEKGRLRSFCCNHHGYVVNENHASLGIRNVNGHSFLDPKHRSNSSNCAIMSKITTEMAQNPQETVRGVARTINLMAGGHTAIQRVTDFISGRATAPGEMLPTLNPVVTNHQARCGVDIGLGLQAVEDLLSDYQDYLYSLDGIVPGVVSDKSYVYGPEVKYYSPRVNITPGWEVAEVPGLYVIGNASGYLDSFIAAATSGIIAARSIIGGN
jgi:uncharacterized FAD-dependent dehydrogenase